MTSDLAQAVLDRPDDLDAHRVYADALTEQGDPRGELIQVQLQLEDPAVAGEQRATLVAREQALIAEHGPGWLGPLADELLGDTERNAWARVDFAFERGFLRRLELGELTVAMVRALRESDETQYLRRLVIESTEYVEEEVELDGVELDEDTSLLPFLPWSALRRLRHLQLGEIDDDNTHTNGEGVVERLFPLRDLEVLHLGLLHLEPALAFGLELPQLRELLVYHVYHYELSVLAKNRYMASLERLGCRPHGLEPGDEDPYIRRSGLIALTESPHLKSLRHLELRASDIGDEGVKAMLDSGFLGRLRILDLHYGEITDAGARLLAGHPDAQKLERLDIGGNALTDAGLKALEEAGVAFVSDEQFTLDDEREYLWYGCPE